ncbi:MAG: ATP-binding cassette domain-containing protein [Baekduia sp.]
MAARLTLERVAVPRRDFSVRVDLACADEVVAVVGPSGSGKTTVLRAIAGLERPAAGRIALGGSVWFDGAARVDVAPELRTVGWVPQEHALFPHMTVAENVGFGGPAGDLLGRLGIAGLADERPGRLSGGERQRVALARALARGPELLLLDEPLASLDAHTRVAVRNELAERLAALGLPTLLVTHDFRDAAALASRVVVLREGTVVQDGTPAELVAAPSDDFVAALVGA